MFHLKSLSRFCLVLVGLAFLRCRASAQEGHRISVTVRKQTGGWLYLGNYYGSQTYLTDSARMNAQGTAVFQGPGLIPPGIYFILLPDHIRFFEILMPSAHQQFHILADTSDLVGDLQVSGSPDNSLFYQYNRYLSQQSSLLARDRSRWSKPDPADSAAYLGEERRVNGQIIAYRQQFIRNHPQAELSEIFRAMEDPVVPKAPSEPGIRPDSLFAYHFYREHYWDGVSFRDSVLLRTPILESRLQKYFSHLVPPVPDSINEAADKILARASRNKGLYKFTLWWLTRHYENSPYMGMDAVFVHLVETYYVPLAHIDWMTRDQLTKLIDRAYAMAPNLIGEKAPDLVMKDSLMRTHSLYDIKARYILLVFWDPTCGHCITEVPSLDSAYRASWKALGVRMLGIRSDGTRDQWEDFIRQHHLDSWLHWWDPDDQSHFRQLYDVTATPCIYLLDRNKKIIAKRLGVRGISNFLEHLQQQRSLSAKGG